MIISPAVKVYDKKQGETLILPCHKYEDIPQIFHSFGYYDAIFHILDEGFIDQNNEYCDKLTAYKEAWECNQISHDEPYESKYLLPEDLYAKPYVKGFNDGYEKSIETINTLRAELNEIREEHLSSLRR